MATVVDVPGAHVAKQACYECGKASDVVAFESVIEGEGTLGLCVSCLLEAAATAGYEPVETWPYEDHIEALVGDLDVAKAEIDRYERFVTELVSLGQSIVREQDTSQDADQTDE